MDQVSVRVAISEEHKTAWNRAVQLWLDSRRSLSTRRGYAAALEDLLSSTGHLPWDVTRADMIGWVGQLKTRGLADGTIALRLAGVSSFYRFCMEEYTIQVNGRETGLAVYNPAASRSLRPRVEPYGKSSYLTAEQARLLLAAIDRSTVKGKRDYALLL